MVLIVQDIAVNSRKHRKDPAVYDQTWVSAGGDHIYTHLIHLMVHIIYVRICDVPTKVVAMALPKAKVAKAGVVTHMAKVGPVGAAVAAGAEVATTGAAVVRAKIAYTRVGR